MEDDVITRLLALALVMGFVVACGGGGSGAASAGAGAAATQAPSAAATEAPAGSDATSWLPNGTAGLKVTVDGKTTIYTVTCTIEGPEMQETSIKVEGKNGADSATFLWVPGQMPSVGGETGGVAWNAPDLSASRSFSSAQAWKFNGSIADTGAAVEGEAVCK
jgi:hypothetical protein